MPRISANVNGGTSTFRDWFSEPSQKPATPRRGKIRSTKRLVRVPYALTSIRSPTRTSSALARSAPIAAWPSPGASPETPVASGSPPNRDAAGKSTPTTRALGSDMTCPRR